MSRDQGWIKVFWGPGLDWSVPLIVPFASEFGVFTENFNTANAHSLLIMHELYVQSCYVF